MTTAKDLCCIIYIKRAPFIFTQNTFRELICDVHWLNLPYIPHSSWALVVSRQPVMQSAVQNETTNCSQVEIVRSAVQTLHCATHTNWPRSLEMTSSEIIAKFLYSVLYFMIKETQICTRSCNQLLITLLEAQQNDRSQSASVTWAPFKL